jgi:hypothetical protein
MPTPPKPTELKRKMGNPSGRPLPELTATIPLPQSDEPPQPHRPLDAEGMRMWNQVWSIAKTWVSAYSDAEHLLLLCETIDERQQLRNLVMSGEAHWRDRVALRAIDSQVASMLGMMGFNPAQRSRLGVAEVKRESVLDQLIARREADRLKRMGK